MKLLLLIPILLLTSCQQKNHYSYEATYCGYKLDDTVTDEVISGYMGKIPPTLSGTTLSVGNMIIENVCDFSYTSTPLQ